MGGSDHGVAGLRPRQRLQRPPGFVEVQHVPLRRDLLECRDGDRHVRHHPPRVGKRVARENAVRIIDGLLSEVGVEGVCVVLDSHAAIIPGANPVLLAELGHR